MHPLLEQRIVDILHSRARALLDALDGWTLGWLLAGGACYTLGTFFYHRPSLRYSHAVWHLFVVAGSVCHYISVMAQVV